MQEELPQTIEECHSLINRLFLIIEQMKVTQAEMAAEILQLKEKLNQNSGNSSLPPSSDGFKQPIKSQLPKVTGKKGGQVGHLGKTLEMVEAPDRVSNCEPSECVCGETKWVSEGFVAERRQVFDLPAPKLEITEYRRITRRCQCGETVSGKFPEAVVGSTRYGRRVQAMTALLSVHGGMAFRKIGQLFKDLCGYRLNESTIQTMLERTAEKMPYEQIREGVLTSEVVNFDESGVRVKAILHWLHNASTKYLTYQFVNRRRGRLAMTAEESILPEFEGIGVHDCLPAYFKFGQMSHAICNAHLLRELNGIVQNAESNWGWQMQQLLTSLYLASDAGTGKIEDVSDYEKRYRRILEIGEVEEPPPKRVRKKGKLMRTKGRNLLERMKKHEAEILLFAKKEEVPFTNNQAERDIRPIKTKQKINGGFGSPEGAENYVKINSLLSTLRKQKREVFKELTELLDGKEFCVFQS